MGIPKLTSGCSQCLCFWTAISRLPKFFHQIVVSATSRGNLAAIVSGDSVSGECLTCKP